MLKQISTLSFLIVLALASSTVFAGAADEDVDGSVPRGEAAILVGPTQTVDATLQMARWPSLMEGDMPVWDEPVEALRHIELLPDVWHRGSFIPGYEPQS